MDLKRKLLKIDSIIISSNIIIIVLLNITRSNCQSRPLYAPVQIYEHCNSNIHALNPPESFYLVHDKDDEVPINPCFIVIHIPHFHRINIHVQRLKMTNMFIQASELDNNGGFTLRNILTDGQNDHLTLGLVNRIFSTNNTRILFGKHDMYLPGKINTLITITLYQNEVNERKCHELDSTNLFCGNGQCLPGIFKCDGVENCLFGHDEKNCPNQPWLLILLSISTAIMFLIISSALIWFGWTKIIITREIVTTAKSSKTINLENHHSLSI
ncbi:uncharacterized protein LOC128391412 isoform X2 [Panonychus citri]|uniref:uncharacterized protein LOC128391412 isoform X2 n=1 Tax=Panonychus citri TaxID=50023 RepID=UPI0023077D94|nr:uncharacterized protein LOC128391412 isoform X2 [Panonychus citri]